MPFYGIQRNDVCKCTYTISSSFWLATTCVPYAPSTSAARSVDVHGVRLVASSFQKASARNKEQAPISSPGIIFSSSCGLVDYTVQTLKRDSERGKTASPQNPPFVHWKAMTLTVVHTCAVKETPVFLRYWVKIIYSMLRLHCRRVKLKKKKK